ASPARSSIGAAASSLAVERAGDWETGRATLIGATPSEVMTEGPDIAETPSGPTSITCARAGAAVGATPSAKAAAASADCSGCEPCPSILPTPCGRSVTVNHDGGAESRCTTAHFQCVMTQSS